MVTTAISADDGGWGITGLPVLFNHFTSNTISDAVVAYEGADKSLWRRGILRFDLTIAAGLTLTNATLTRDINLITGAGGHTMRFARVLNPDTVGDDPCWIDQDHSETDPWDDDGGDFDYTGPPAGLSITEPTVIGIHIITAAGLLTLVEDARDNRDNELMLLVYLSDEDPGSNVGTRWGDCTLTLTSPDPTPIVTPTAHHDIVVSRDHGRRPRAGSRVPAPRRPRSPRSPRP